MGPVVSNSSSDWVRESSATRNIIIGTGVLALGSYVLLAITSRQLSAHEYSLFAAFWSVVMGLILGATAPLETFGLSTTTINNSKPQIDKQFESAIRIVLLAVLGVVFFVLPWFIPRVFDGQWSFLVATVLALFGFTLTYSARGVLVVDHRSGRYASLMSLESLLRIGLAATFILLIGPGGAYVALAVSLSAIIAGLLGYKSIRAHISLRLLIKKDLNRNSKNFVPLLVASLATLILLNLGPFIVQYLSGAEAAAAGIFLNALTLSRVPIMFGPVLQARLVPSVSAILLSGDFPTLRRLIGKGMRGLIISGLVFVAGFTLLGDIAINILFGGNSTLNHLDLALLAIPTFLYLIAIAFQSVLVALKETRKIAKAWVLGLVAYLFALLLPNEAILKVEVAGVMAMSTVVVLLFYQLSTAMKSGLSSNTISAE